MPQTHAFTLGAGDVIEGLEIGTEGMQEGGVRRIVVPPPMSYQNKNQEPIPRAGGSRRRHFIRSLHRLSRIDSSVSMPLYSKRFNFAYTTTVGHLIVS